MTTRLKRASYRDAVDFIAHNDDPEMTVASEITSNVSVVLVATIFGITPERVAGDVVLLRTKGCA